jgi:hypothetical protein
MEGSSIVTDIKHSDEENISPISICITANMTHVAVGSSSKWKDDLSFSLDTVVACRSCSSVRNTIFPVFVFLGLLMC